MARLKQVTFNGFFPDVSGYKGYRNEWRR
jgi:hypothetical protein